MRNLLLALMFFAVLVVGSVAVAEASRRPDTLDPTGAVLAAPASAIAPQTMPARLPDATAASGILVHYSIPVTPTHVIVAANGQVWYSSFFGTALGSLDPATQISRIYTLPEQKNIYGVTPDASGGVWYTTANALGGNDAVGRLNTVTNLINEWKLPRSHFGLHVDPATQNVWFVSKGTATDHLARLNPQTNQITRWDISPYTDTYNLDIAPNGDIWFTVQPRGLQGIGRLTPSTGQVTLWKLPAPTARPFQLHVISAGEVWLTEFDPSGNSISRLTPETGILTRYVVPTPGGSPAGIVKVGERIWFTEYEGNKIGFLEPASGARQTVPLQSQTYTAPSIVSTLTPAVIAPQVSKSASSAREFALNALRRDAFVEFPLPIPNSSPLEIVTGQNGALWFTEMGGLRISQFLPPAVVPASSPVFLPLMLR